MKAPPPKCRCKRAAAKEPPKNAPDPDSYFMDLDTGFFPNPDPGNKKPTF